GLVILGEFRVRGGMVAVLKAEALEIGERLPCQVRLIEQPVRRASAGQDVEGGGPAQFGMPALELLEDAYRAVGIDLPAPVLLKVAELAGRGVVEGQHDRRGALGQVDLAVEIVAQGHGAVAALPEPPEVPAEVGGRAGPAL